MTSNTAAKIIIRSGRTGPTWSAVPDWIMFAGYSVQAQQVYKILKAHCNTERGDGLVWPTQTVIAMLLKGSKMTGAPRGDKIKPYIDELARDLSDCPEGSGGAITVEYTATMPRRTIYTVHDAPPPGYTGPLTLADWYRANGPATRCTPVRGRRRTQPAHVDNPSQAKDQVSAVTPAEGRQPRPGQTQETPGQPSYPPQGVTSHPVQGVTSYPPQGVLTRRTQPDEPTTPPNPPHEHPAPDAVEHGGGGQEPDDKNLNAAHRVLIEAIAQVPPAKRPGRAQATRLSVRIAAAIAEGWSTADLVDRLGSGIAGANSVTGALTYRLDQLPELTQPAPADDRPARPAHCGRCYEQTRMTVDEDDRMVPCPRCHPDQVGAA